MPTLRRVRRTCSILAATRRGPSTAGGAQQHRVWWSSIMCGGCGVGSSARRHARRMYLRVVAGAACYTRQYRELCGSPARPSRSTPRLLPPSPNGNAQITAVRSRVNPIQLNKRPRRPRQPSRPAKANKDHVRSATRDGHLGPRFRADLGADRLGRRYSCNTKTEISHPL